MLIITWKPDSLLKNIYPLLMYKSHTFDVPGIDLVKRSASMSYFKVLKHSSRSSRNWAYVRTHAEQSQAVPFSQTKSRRYDIINFCVHAGNRVSRLNNNEKIDKKEGFKEISYQEGLNHP